MTEDIRESTFDDEYTRRRKWANHLETYFDTLITLDGKYVNLEDEKDGYYAKYYNDDISFSALATDILQEYKYIFVLDIIMSFVKYIDPSNISNDDEKEYRWESLFEEFYAVNSNRKYESSDDFMKYYNEWNALREKSLESNGIYDFIINRTQKDMEELEKKAEKDEHYITSKFKYNNVSLVINPTLKDGSVITYKDGIEIFDNIVVSENVPFAKYNDEVKSYYKIYKGSSLSDVPNYANIDIPEDQSNDINIIYLKLWIKNNADINHTARKDYIKVAYYLKFNRIMFTLPDVRNNIKENEAYEILANTFTNLNLNDRQRVDVKGTFNIFSYEEREGAPIVSSISFNEFSLLDIMMMYINGLDPAIDEGDYDYLFGSYFFLDEVENMFSTKVAMKLHYRSLTSGDDLGNKMRKDFKLTSISKGNIELVSDTARTSEDYFINELDTIMEIPRNTGYIQANVNIKDERELELIIRILKIALYSYKMAENEHIRDNNEMYQAYLGLTDTITLDRDYNVGDLANGITIEELDDRIIVDAKLDNEQEYSDISRVLKSAVYAYVYPSQGGLDDLNSIYLTYSDTILSNVDMDDYGGMVIVAEEPDDKMIRFEIEADSLDLLAKTIDMALYTYEDAEKSLEDGEITKEYIEILGKETVNKLKTYQKTYKLAQPEEHEESNSKKLKKLDRDIFVSSYPTICRNIPLAIDEEEIEEWKKRTVTEIGPDGKKIVRERQVISFPKNDPKYHFVCEDPAPYIGMIKNTLSNRKEHSHLPCCYLVDQQVPGEATRFNEYYRDIKTGPKGAKSKGLVKGKFILLPERYGNLPVQLNEALNLYNKTPTKFYRYGVPNTVNSLLHCVCKALSIEMYNEIERGRDPDLLEEYIAKIRGVLSRMPNVYRQELYDRSESEIVEALVDGSIFLDPALFYRGIEELFDINIFTFVPTVDSATIEVPRKWLFHVSKSKPERTNILIYKHYGSNRDTLEYPQCELIVKETSEGLVGTFNEDMYNVCSALRGGMVGTIVWTPQLGISPETDTIEGNEDFYSLVDYDKIIEHSAYEQYIDSYGKCRGYNFKVSDGEATFNMTMITPPTQPEDLPLMSSIHYVNHELAITLFGKHTKIDMIDDKVVGLWFKVFDVKEGIYVPIKEIKLSELSGSTELSSSREVGGSNPIYQDRQDKAKRYTILKRTVSVILELLKWLYEVYKLDRELPDGDVGDFVDKYYMIDDDFTGDSLEYYDFSKIPYRLPNVNSFDDAISFLSNLNTNLIVDNRIIFYNEEFAEKAHEYITKYDKNVEGLAGNPQLYVGGYFNGVNDYKSNKNIIIFIGSKTYREWLEKMVYGPFRMFDIDNKKFSLKAFISTPYIILEDGVYIIIQNVIGGEYSRAITVSLNWVKYKINSGYNTISISDEEIDRTVKIDLYTISVQNRLMYAKGSGQNPGKSKRRTNVNVLKYGNSERYAAMLLLN